jgi:putative transposase
MRLAETGERLHRMVRLDRTFLIETCPPADQSGERQVDVRRGVKVNHLWYWTDAFRSARIDGLSVPVRVDPWDVRFCYVLIGQDWHQCVCKLGMALRRLTRVELESYFEEMTKRRGLQRRELTPERIGEWMQVLDRHAFDQRLQKQQAETRLIYDALNLTTVEPAESSPVMQSQGPGCDDSSAPEVAREDDEYDLY